MRYDLQRHLREEGKCFKIPRTADRALLTSVAHCTALRFTDGFFGGHHNF